jgi:hypothetical protein
VQIQTQQTSATSGNSSIRIQDDGRYTQILKMVFLFSLVPQVEFTANTAIRQQVEF